MGSGLETAAGRPKGTGRFGDAVPGTGTGLCRNARNPQPGAISGERIRADI